MRNCPKIVILCFIDRFSGAFDLNLMPRGSAICLGSPPFFLRCCWLPRLNSSTIIIISSVLLLVNRKFAMDESIFPAIDSISVGGNQRRFLLSRGWLSGLIYFPVTQGGVGHFLHSNR